MTWTNQTCLILGGDTGDSLMRTWSNDILAAAPKKNYMSSQSLFSTTQRDPGKETYLIEKSRADVAGKLTDDDNC